MQFTRERGNFGQGTAEEIRTVPSRQSKRCLRSRRTRPLAAVAVLACALAPGAQATVSPSPAPGTPQLAPTGTTEQVRQIVQCGSNMYAVGSFTRILWNGTTYARRNAFSFGAAAPYKITSWNPGVDGKVNSIALGPRCNTAYLGGKFTSVSNVPARNLAAISATTGKLKPTFAHEANNTVQTLLLHDGHLLIGGYFTAVNGSDRRYMASLNPTTGSEDGFVQLRISGRYSYCSRTRCTNSTTNVYNQQLSHDGTRDLVEGTFTSVGGLDRQQIFMLNVAGKHASVTGWRNRGFYKHCAVTEPFYIRAASWSPDDETIYTASTGFRSLDFSGFPLSGLCDTAAAFPSKPALVGREWINYTGCDSLYSTAADSGTAYFGGHERWSENAFGCNSAGPGAIVAPGMEGLSPTTGKLIFNPTRARGLGADDMLLTGAGLWIASDNAFGSQTCGGVPGHAGICLLPH